jgi:hypothetical protein
MVAATPKITKDNIMVLTGWKVQNTAVVLGESCLPAQDSALYEYNVAKVVA